MLSNRLYFCEHVGNHASAFRMKPADYLRGVAPLSDFDDTELEDLLRASTLRPLQTGDVLFHEGEPAGGMVIVLRGQVALTRMAQGGSINLATVGFGEMLGELGLLDGAPRTATATVTQPGQGLVVDRQEFALLRSMGTSTAAKLERQLCRVLCERLRKTTDTVAQSGPKPSPPRITKPLRSSTQPPGGVPQLRTEDESAEGRQKGHRLAVGVGFGPVSVEMLRRIPLLHALDRHETEMLLGVLQDVRVLAGDVICKEGDKADSAYLVLDGEVAVTKGRDRLTTLGPNSLIGQIGLIDRGRRSAGCVARIRTRLLKLRCDDFDRLFTAQSQFAYKIVDALASSLCTQLRIADQELSDRAPASLEMLDFSALDDPALDAIEVVTPDQGRRSAAHPRQQPPTTARVPKK